ncbi:MAG: thioesterase, partial [Gammaproteobacteria bacterium]|nr:thioesterase [Gammaproteobacteria bacterium]
MPSEEHFRRPENMYAAAPINAFFAANSYEAEVFVLTTAFTTYLTRPVSSGVMQATGRVVYRSRSQ